MVSDTEWEKPVRLLFIISASGVHENLVIRAKKKHKISRTRERRAAANPRRNSTREKTETKHAKAKKRMETHRARRLC